MADVNSYVNYKKIRRSNLMTVKGFGRHIAVTYVKKGTIQKQSLGRLVKMQITSSSSVLPDIQFDEIQYVMGKRRKQRRCQ